MQTMKDWTKSKLSLDKFLNAGDTIDDDLLDYVIEVLPPIQTKGVIQMGEPHSAVKGQFVYYTFRDNGDNWYYSGFETNCRKTTQ